VKIIVSDMGKLFSVNYSQQMRKLLSANYEIIITSRHAEIIIDSKLWDNYCQQIMG
jgi:hypothetical protein